MSYFSSLEIKRFFFDNLSDIILVLLFLVAVLFLVFSIMHLLRKRKNLINDTEPYLIHLKTSLDELIKEADELKKELTQAKLSTNTAAAAASSADNGNEEVVGLQNLVDEKSKEIGKLKEEIKKLENAEKDRKKTDPSKSSVNDAEFNSLKEENQKLKAQLDETEKQVTSGAAASVDLDKLKGENAKLNEKLGSLETKIAEYEIIEDDLANLKILKEENEKLKAQIEELHTMVGETDASGGDAKPVPAKASEPAAVDTGIVVENSNNDQLQAEIDNVLQQFDSEMQKEMGAKDAAVAQPVEQKPVPLVVNAPVATTEQPAAAKTVEPAPAAVEESVDPDLLKEFGLDPNDMQASASVASTDAAPVATPTPAAAVVVEEPKSEEVPAEPIAVAPPSAEPQKEEQKPEVSGENIEGKLAEEFEKFMAENH